MKYLFTFLVLFICLDFNSYAAVKVVQCEDEQGDKTFHKVCPPGTTQVGSQRIAISGGSSEDTDGDDRPSVTFYTVKTCDVCSEIRKFLQSSEIPITEKDAEENVAVQEELKQLAGKLKVPVVKIGDTVISGMDRTELINTLRDAGYSLPENEDITESGEEEPETSEEVSDINEVNNEEIDEEIDDFE